MTDIYFQAFKDTISDSFNFVANNGWGIACWIVALNIFFFIGWAIFNQDKKRGQNE